MLKKIAPAIIALSVLTSACAHDAVPSVGVQAPGIELFDTNNQVMRLSDYLGRPVVINFWGVHCDYCIYEMPALEEVYRRESDKDNGAAFLAVNVQDSAAAARAFINDNGYTMPVLMDAGGQAARAYGVYAIPVTFFIDRTGIIRYIKIGVFVDADEINTALDTIRQE